MKYRVVMSSSRILYYTGEVIVEAATVEEAMEGAEWLAEEGEVDWGDSDFDDDGPINITKVEPLLPEALE